jgi:uncharacterized protein
MNKRLLARELVVRMPLILLQLGIYFELLRRVGTSDWRKWGVRIYAVFAIFAGCVSSLGGLWALGYKHRGLFWDFESSADGVCLTALFTTSAIYLVYLACRVVAKMVPATVSQERRKLLQAAGTLAVASPLAAMGYGILVGRVDFGVREVSLAIPNLHPDLEGLRILHLSDVHLGEFLSEREFARAIDMTNGLRPHLAIMTGDLISKPGDPIDKCVGQLARVRADAGMIGCLGNHEMYADAEALVKAEGARRGIKFLRHEHRALRFGNATINIGGVDYQRTAERKTYLNGVEKLLAPGALNLLLSHNPDVFPKAASQGWELTLSGHTHGGQVTMEIVEQSVNIARFFTPFVAGEYHLGNASCYVTRGIGTVGVPARLGVPPEITLLTLRKA